MARNRGPVWKVSRRLGLSVLETGEELVREIMHLDNTDQLKELN